MSDCALRSPSRSKTNISWYKYWNSHQTKHAEGNICTCSTCPGQLASSVLFSLSLLALHIAPLTGPCVFAFQGRPGMSEISSCLESQGCHLISLSYLLSCFVFSCLVLLLFLSCHFSANGSFSWLFFQKTFKYFSLRVRLFCMALVEQLGDDSWSVVCAACCHMALVFAIMHLCNIYFILYCVCPFLFYIFL